MKSRSNVDLVLVGFIFALAMVHLVVAMWLTN
jgi:hypothetical protein